MADYHSPKEPCFKSQLIRIRRLLLTCQSGGHRVLAVPDAMSARIPIVAPISTCVNIDRHLY
jgi:hypothetical protein